MRIENLIQNLIKEKTGIYIENVNDNIFDLKYGLTSNQMVYIFAEIKKQMDIKDFSEIIDHYPLSIKSISDALYSID